MDADATADLRKRIEGLSAEERRRLAGRLDRLRRGESGDGASGGGEQELVAYVVPGARSLPSPGELRDFLRQRLPAYMLPSAFVVMDALPKSPNGKIDLRALPSPDRARAGRKQFVAPRTPVEERLAGIWRDVLGIERVGLDDNFADLGGHSLLAIRVMTRLREAFAVALPLRSLFETSTLGELASLVQAAAGSASRPELPPLGLAPRNGPLPLSLAQRGLWSLDQMEPGNPFYNVYSPVRLTGPLNAVLLQRSLTEVVRRHEILRATFPSVEGRPVQVIADAEPMPLPVVDLRELSGPAREAKLRRLAREEIRRPFDLAAGPLLRVTLVRLGHDDNALLLTLHHMVADLWSAGLLLREVGLIYDALCRDEAPALPELRLQYADYAHWQQSWSQGEFVDRQVAYWKKRLAGAPPMLALPTDHPRPAAQSFRGDRVPLRLPVSLVASLRELGRAQGTTLFVTLLAAFKLLLHRYTGETDICVASPVANRSPSELEELIGYFLNTLVLRSDLSGDPSFRELVARVRDVAFEAFEYRDLPAERVLEALQVERSLSHNPLTQVGFALQNAPIGALELRDLSVSLLDVHSGTTKCDLALLIWDVPDGLAGMVEYSTDLFEEASIARMVTAFESLLESVVADPDRPISRVRLVGPAARVQSAVDRSAPGAVARARCVHELIEAQCARTPADIAVVAGDQEISYADLNHRSNQLAHYLRRLGVGPNDLVGVCMEKSLEMVVAVLGVLKAGGAYVPLDPAYPAPRLSGMLESAGVSLLLTQHRLLPFLPPLSTRVFSLDADWPKIADQSAENPTSRTTPDRRIYTIFTSGSTGTPKLAAVLHRGFTNLVEWFVEEFRITAADRTLLVSSFNFDLTQKNIFAPLMTGGRLYLPATEGYEPEAIRESIGAHQITLLNCTPSAFYPLVDEVSDAELRRLGSLRHVFLGGEPIAMRRVRAWTGSSHCRAEIVNTYGPTECADICAFYRVRDPGAFLDRPVPIGRPIPNARLYVLDSGLSVLPVGALGELCVGGEGVGAGYVNDVELTSQRFLPDPFDPTPGARLYRTGDLVRYRPDGNVEFVGRIDHQVKIRGFRIELGEIEGALAQHAALREVVVVAREHASGNRRLVAYVVCDPAAPVAPGELRAFLRGKLPEYMVPAAFVTLDALPLTPNGKVDRRALPEPDPAAPVTTTPFVAPRTAPEATLAAIVAEVLGRDRVGIHDNFFELGGDSILAIQAIARANRAGLRLTPRQVFQHQTIAELASVIGSAAPIASEEGIVEGATPLTPIQRYFLEECTIDPHHFNQTVLLEIQRPLDAGHLRSTVDRLLAHHDALRARFEPGRSGWTQRIAGLQEPPAHPVLVAFDLIGLAPDEQARRIEREAAALQGSLDLSNGPLIRVAHFHLGAGAPDRLLLVIHHLAVDGVSWRILLEDLQTAYLQTSRGEELVLPRKGTSFRTWARRLSEHARSGALQAHKDFWLAESASAAGTLPLDRPDGVNTVASTATVTVSLGPADTKALLQDVPAVYRTQINDVLLSALVQACAVWTGRGSLRIALEGHGREDLFEDVDVSRTVGWFTTLYPVTLHLTDPQPGEALKSVKEQLRRVANHGLAYGMLRYLSDDAEVVAALVAPPRPAVTFNYLGQFDQALPTDLTAVIARESTGPTQSGRAIRTQLLDVVGSVVGGDLSVTWTYSRNLHDRPTIERLADEFVRQLRLIVAHCTSPGAGGYTPSDFPDASLNQEELDELLGELGEGDGTRRAPKR